MFDFVPLHFYGLEADDMITYIASVSHPLSLSHSTTDSRPSLDTRPNTDILVVIDAGGLLHDIWQTHLGHRIRLHGLWGTDRRLHAQTDDGV